VVLSPTAEEGAVGTDKSVNDVGYAIKPRDHPASFAESKRIAAADALKNNTNTISRAAPVINKDTGTLILSRGPHALLIARPPTKPSAPHKTPLRKL